MGDHSMYRIAPGARQDEAVLAYVQEYWPREEWARGIIFLPNRRSVTLVRQAFLRLAEDMPALLPAMLPLADIDPYLVLLSSCGAEVGPGLAVMPPLKRRCLLAAQVKRFFDARKEPCNSRYAMLMADALSDFLDQCTRYDVQAGQFAGLVDMGFDAHWQRTLAFLSIVIEHWPQIEREQGVTSHAAYVHEGLKRLASVWEGGSVDIPVLAAGSTGSQPATAALLCAIAGLPRGALLLPGVPSLTQAEEEAIEQGHPLYHVRQLAARCGVALHALPPVGERETTEACFIADAFGAAYPEHSVPAKHHMLACGDEWEEARAISLIVRDALEVPGKTVMVVSPERALLKRVGNMLLRWGIRADSSSADTLLAHGYIQWCLRLLEMVDSNADPVHVLAFFQHPLNFAGDDACRDAFVEVVDKGYARGVVLRRGGYGVDRAIRSLRGGAYDGQADAVGQAMSVLFRCGLASCSLEEWFSAIGAVASACAVSSADEVVEALFAQVQAQGDGEMVDAQFCRLMIEYAADVPWFAPPVEPFHPRVMLHSPIEARMAHADVVVLAGLNEGSWPRITDNPWVNRRMQEKLGLPTVEHELSLQAHDFLLLASHREVYFTRAVRVAQSISTASRWWRRLEFAAMRRGEGGVSERAKCFLQWASGLDAAAGYAPATPPLPNPPVSMRPAVLRATEVEELLFNPYAIYARHVLELREPDAIDEAPDNRLFGTLAHKVLEQAGGATMLDEAHIDAFIDDVLRRYGDAPNVSLLWRERLHRCVQFFLEAQEAYADELLGVETEKPMRLQLSMGDALLHVEGRADRVEALSSGERRFVDYKSGKAPPKKQLLQGEAPQLLLYHMAWRSLAQLQESTAHCAYWQLPNGADEGAIIACDVPGDALVEIAGRYGALAAYYLREANPFPYAPHAVRRHYRYAELARAAEWGGA